MGLFDFFKKRKNIYNDDGINIIFSENGRGYLTKIFEQKNGKKHGLLHSYNDIGELHYSQVWNNGKYGGPRYRKSITERLTEITRPVMAKGVPFTNEEKKEIEYIQKKVDLYKSQKNYLKDEKMALFNDEKIKLMKLHKDKYPCIDDVKGTAWEKKIE